MNKKEKEKEIRSIRRNKLIECLESFLKKNETEYSYEIYTYSELLCAMELTVQEEYKRINSNKSLQLSGGSLPKAGCAKPKASTK